MQTTDLDQIDFFAPDLLSDPYALFARLRPERPVMRFHQTGFNRDQYIISSYGLVERILRDPENFSSLTNEIFTGGGNGAPEAEAIYAQSWPEVNTLLTSDEPDHTRLRALVSKAFMPARIRRMSALITETVNALIGNFAARGECDFVREFAIPLPIHSIGAILGIDRAFYGKLYDWTFSLMRRNGQMATAAEQVHDAGQVVELKNFVVALIEQRRAAPGDDLISDLVTAEIDGASPFTDLEVLSTILLMILGGAETTRSTLIAAMVRLLQNPTQLALLQFDLSLTPKAVEEVLRLDTPGTALWRIAAREQELAGVTIPQGAIVMNRIDAANRDPAVFEDPDAFNILRPNANRSLAFGAGIHYCVGFRLAREQLNLSLPALVTRLKDARIVMEKSDLTAHPSAHTRCLKALYLAFTPGA